MTVRVLGVDGCRDGWVGVGLDPGPVAYAAPDLATLIARAENDGAVGRVGVDIPIGLTEDVERKPDRAAQELLGPRRSSIFVTPVRAALAAADHATGVAINRRTVGAGFSIQAWGLRAKIFEVDELVEAGEQRLVEVHPELSFRALAGRPATYPKKTWAGQRERLDLLERAGIDLRALEGDTGSAAPDDVVDAAVCAWTARRVEQGVAVSVPDPPQELGRGRTAAIWA